MPAILIAVAISLSAMVTPGRAQTSDSQPLLPAASIPLDRPTVPPSIAAATLTASDLAERRIALKEWMREYTEWTAWNDRWRGRPEPGWFGNRERRPKPEPPVWLFEECLNLADIDAMVDACQLLDSWNEDPATAQRRTQTSTAPTHPEDPTRTTFWNHVHADALWVTPSSSASYGVIGIHITLKVAGRWQVFAAPGAMLLNVPTPQGTRAWQPATDLGFSYRLFDLTLPGSRNQGTVHLNVARAWILGGSGSFINSSVDLAGLSLTFK